ncbi:BRO family protein [Sporolactobacillus terrae]|uniref:BRO family protein n=1 Tax=Sporolactobacillus terrae TaxID=269673 RepID=UPI00048B74C7|nr:BRO family protein [Sporolactobacillus terrae]
MSDVHEFDFKGIPVSVIGNENEIWFKALDVCKAVGISNVSDAMNRLDEDEVKTILSSTEVGSYKSKTNFISEPGLYHLLNGSRKSEARPFQRWVNHDVLPTIRKSGQYSNVKPLNDKQSLIAAMKLSTMVAEETDQLKKITQQHSQKLMELGDKVENQITLDHGEQRRVQKAVSHRVSDFEKYDKKRRSELYHEIYREIKDRFAVPSYKDILRKDLESAIKYIEAFIPKKVA